MEFTYFQVIPSNLNYLIFSYLTVSQLFFLCQTAKIKKVAAVHRKTMDSSFDLLICSKDSFWSLCDHRF